MIVVSDTSPINYLILIGEIELLPRLYGNVILPQSVLGELLDPRAPELVRNWAESPPSWVEVRSATKLLSLPNLDPGETEAISLAVEAAADFVLIDERKGRRIAAEQGLVISGTLIVLELAAREELRDLSKSIEKLKATSFHISDQAIAEALTRDEERKRARGEA